MNISKNNSSYCSLCEKEESTKSFGGGYICETCIKLIKAEVNSNNTNSENKDENFHVLNKE